MNANTNLPTEYREPRPIDVVKQTIARKADEFKAVLPAHISIEKFQRTIATAALANPKLFECDRKSLLMASMKAAQDGLLPDGREAALVPFKNRVKLDNGKFGDSWEVQYMPMVYGLRKKVLQSGEVISIETGVVYRAEVEGGHFIYEIGLEPPIRYRPKMDLTAEETADSEIVVAYSIARLKNPTGGDPYWSVEVLRRFEIDKIRQMSQTGAVGRTIKYGKDAGKPIEPKGPWVDWFAAMAEKTALRQHTKALPMSGDLLDTLIRDDEEERRAQGAARLLETEPDEPKVLPSAEELDEHVDPETGEVLDNTPATDSRGMTETDEETARRLDAGDNPNDGTLSRENPTAAEGPADSQRGEDPDADFVGVAKPEGARHGQTWFNPETGQMKHAHDKGDHGIKWYLNPPEEDQAAIAAQTARDIDGPLDDQSDEPMWKGKLDGLRAKLAKAATIKAVDGVERDWLNLVRPAVDDEGVVAAFEREIADRKRAIKAEG